MAGALIKQPVHLQRPGFVLPTLNTCSSCRAPHKPRHQQQQQVVASPNSSSPCSKAQQHAEVALCSGSGSGNGGSTSARRFRGGDDNSSGPNRPSTAWAVLQQLLAVLIAVFLPALLPSPAAAAARSGFVSQRDEKMMASSWQLDAFVDRMWDLSGPIINNMGFSGLVGACTAAALKLVGRALAATLGIGLILVQVLSHYNYITVNWSVVHKQARQVLDTTGDGRLDQDDFKRFVKQGLVVLSEGVPSLSGFLVGLLVGMKLF